MQHFKDFKVVFLKCGAAVAAAASRGIPVTTEKDGERGGTCLGRRNCPFSASVHLFTLLLGAVVGSSRHLTLLFSPSFTFPPSPPSGPPTPPPPLHLVLPCMSVAPSGLRQRVRARMRMFRLLRSEEALLTADSVQTHVLWMRPPLPSPPLAAALKGPARCRGGGGSLTSLSEGGTPPCLSRPTCRPRCR